MVLDNFFCDKLLCTGGQGHKHFTPSWFSGPRMAEEATLFNTLVMVASTLLDIFLWSLGVVI